MRQYDTQIEREKVEQAAQASHANSMLIEVDQHIFSLEYLVRDSKFKAEATSQLLSGSVSAVYALEGETSRLQQALYLKREDIVGAERVIEEISSSLVEMIADKNII